MSNQIQGEILFDGWAGGAEDQWVYTPWMPVRGDFGTFGVEVVYSTTTLSWTVETRTIESASTTVILSSTQTGAGTVTSTVRAKAAGALQVPHGQHGVGERACGVPGAAAQLAGRSVGGQDHGHDAAR